MARQVSVGMREGVNASLGNIARTSEAPIRNIAKACINDSKGDKEALAELLGDVLLPAVEKECRRSALVGASYYDACRESVKGKRANAIVETRYSGELAESSRNQFVSSLREIVFDSELSESEIVEKIWGRSNYEIRSSFDFAMDAAARGDKSTPRFARVTMGDKNCPFCVMLASRGAAYKSAQAAGSSSHYHENCDCIVTPCWNYKRSFQHQAPSQTWDQYLAKKLGGVWITDDVEGYSPYEELDKAYSMADETASNQKLDDFINENGLRKNEVIEEAIKAGIDLNSRTKMKRLAEVMIAGDDIIKSNDAVSAFEHSIVTHAINDLYYARYVGLDYGSIYFANHEYLFNVYEFNEYSFIWKRAIDE